MNCSKEQKKESLNNCVAKLITVISDPQYESIGNGVSKMLEGLLDELKEIHSQPDDPKPPKNHENQILTKSKKAIFNYKECNAYKKITTEYFWPTIRHSELVSIATAIAERCKGIPVSREEKRRKDLLIKWYDDNWQIIEPHIQIIKVYNKENVQLNGHEPNVHPENDE